MSKEDELKNLREKEEKNEGLWSSLSPEEFLEQQFICTVRNGASGAYGRDGRSPFRGCCQ